MDDTDRYRLLHGPYAAPACRRGDVLTCEYRGADVRVGGLTDAPIPWPRVLRTGKPSLVLCGDLARAVRAESAIAVAHHWGVGLVTVWKWRQALGVDPINEGTARLYREYRPEKITAEAVEKMRRTQRTPEVRARQAEAHRGRPAHPNTRKALLRAARRKWTRNRKRDRSRLFRSLCASGRIRPPIRPDARRFTPSEDQMLGRTLDRTIARLLGCPVHVVRSRRRKLGIPMSRHSRLHHQPKPVTDKDCGT